MTKTEQLAEQLPASDGAQNMFESILYFMRNFKDENGNYPLRDYIGNVRKAMEE